jgi:hypothetical protein
MGFLTNRYVSNPKKKFWIGVVKDAIILLIFLILALSIRGQFDAGLQAGLKLCERCLNPWNTTFLHNTSTEYPINNSFPFYPLSELPPNKLSGFLIP